jgi:hypothetical protein
MNITLKISDCSLQSCRNNITKNKPYSIGEELILPGSKEIVKVIYFALQLQEKL